MIHFKNKKGFNNKQSFNFLANAAKQKITIMKKIVIVAILFLLLHNIVAAQSQTFSTPGDFQFVSPPGVTEITVTLNGAGGGGNPYSGSGGGGGAYTRATFNITNKTIWVHVGQGGISAQSGENSIISWDNNGTKVPFAIAQGGSSFTGVGGAASPVTGATTLSNRGGNGSPLFFNFSDNYYGGGGGGGQNAPDQDAPIPAVNDFSQCRWGAGAFSGGFPIGGTGGNGLGPICGQTVGGNRGGGGGSGDLAGSPGGDGEVQIYWTCPTASAIGKSHTVPYPQENMIYPDTSKINSFRDSLTDANGTSPTGNGLIYAWERSDDGVNNWQTAVGSTNSLKYYLPGDNITSYYRRVSNICNVTSYSTPVKINVVRKDIVNAQYPPGSVGSISGLIISKGGNPVFGDTVLARKYVNLNGSSKDFTYYAVTDNNGRFKIESIFYGKTSNGDGDPGKVMFYVKPLKYGHVFDIVDSTFYNPELTANGGGYEQTIQYAGQAQAFKDLTAVSVSGTTYQQCNACLLPDMITAGPVKRELDSVEIYLNTLYKTKSDSAGGLHGKYAVTIEDVFAYSTITPKKEFSKFDTTGSTIKRSTDTLNFNFRDTATHAISGQLLQGCNLQMGSATLLFTDIPQTGDRIPTFYRRVPTASDGQYTVRLPIGKYRVKMEKFTKSNIYGVGLIETDVTNFFSGDSITSSINPDSLKVDITKSDATLNLIYQRPPQMQLIGWDSVCKTTLGSGYAVWQQLKNYPIQVKVFQGSPTPAYASAGCPLTDDSVRISTTIQTDLMEEKFVFKVDTSAVNNGIVKDTIKAGPPNISGDFTKSLFITYEDKYGRTARIDKKVVVTGSRSRPGQTFVTVSPQIPLLVLHDPPGDQSFSSWKQTNSTESAFRFYFKGEGSVNQWNEAKAGVEFDAGVNAFGITFDQKTKLFGSETFNITAGASNTTTSELIVHTETGEEIYTSPLNTGFGTTQIGAEADVFYGAALNILYGICDNVSFDNCVISKTESPVFAPNKVLTKFSLPRYAIKNNISDLQSLATNPLLTAGYRDSLLNQANTWQQMLDNDDRNKTKAPFVENRTFAGGGTSVKATTSNSSTGTTSIEFGINVETSFAQELGIEVNGTGDRGGVIVKLRVEVGGSVTLATTTATEIAYTLQDISVGDKFSVNIGKDPVYGTPVFTTLGGLSKCPPEEGTIARDEFTLTVNGPSEINATSSTSPVAITLMCGNNSVDPGAKTYNLYLQNNPEGAEVTTGGIPMGSGYTPFPVAMLKGQSIPIPINIKKNQAPGTAFNYKDLQFILTDDCSQLLNSTFISRTQLITVNFPNPCSGIHLSSPEANWLIKKANNNILQIVYDGFTVANLQQVVLQYRKTGGASWLDAVGNNTVMTANDLAGKTSYMLDWNVAPLVEGKYDIRVKLVCSSGLVYSNTASGAIDRKAPSLFGRPDPTDDNYATGDVIAFSYDENIDVSDLNNNKVKMYQLSNNSLIPTTVSGSGNKLVILPSVNLLTLLGDSIRVVVSNISDLNGNVKTTPDTSKFTIGTVPIVAGTNSVSMYMVTKSLYENATGKMEVHFKLNPDPLNTIKVSKVNFSIGGTAKFKEDYDTIFNVVNTVVKNYSTGVNEVVPLYSKFNGSSGYIYLSTTLGEAVLKLDPIGDTLYEPNEPIVINLLSGADYFLRDSTTVTATILNDDLQPPAISTIGEIVSCGTDPIILTANTPNVTPRWATTVVSKSNEYSANEWGAKQALGAPDVYPAYGDIQYAWSPTNPDNTRDYIVLGYSNPAPINFVDIYETYNPGAVELVSLRNATTGVFTTVYIAAATPYGDSSRILHIELPAITTYNVDAVRIELNAAAIPGFNEIDAVSIGLDTTYTSYLWSTGATTKAITVNSTGNYFVTVKNGIGQKVNSDTINVRKSVITSTAYTANSACANPPSGGIQINATGGITPYYYKFDSLTADKFQASKVFKPLKAGIYRVTIKDSIQCVVTTGNITITAPVGITGTFTKTNATCIGKADGTITVTTSGGKAPYGYKVGLGGNYNDGNVITGLKAGTYTIYVKDVNGCIGSVGPVTVGQANVTCLSRGAIAGATAEQGQNGLALVLTPNPSNQQFTLRVFTENKQAVQLRVLDVNGKTLYTAKGSPDQAFKFGDTFVPATYLVEVRQGDVVKTLKAVKMR